MVSEGRAGWRTGLKDLRGKQSRASKHVAQSCFDKTNEGLIAMEIFQKQRQTGLIAGGGEKSDS